MKDRKSDKKGKHFYIRWKRVISVFLVFAMIVTMAGVNLYVQAENPLDVQSEEIKDITKETELSEEETKDTQENTPEDKQETKEEEIREAKDFSQLRELNYTLADFEPSGEDLWYQMKVDAYFEQLPENEAVLEGDTFSFRIPEELFYIEDTKNPVPVEIGSISGFGDKKAQCKDISAAEYTVKNQKVEVTLKKGISELEDISSVFMRMNLSVRVESKALDEQEKAADWVLATSSDGTEKKLSLILPAKENREDKDKADNNKEEKKEAASKASSKKTEKTETKSEEEEKPSITVDGKEITFDENDTKKDALTQEVYWVDNNNPQNRPGKDKFQEFYIENAKIKATVTADDGTTVQEEISVKVLAERLGVKPEELIEVSDAGGTGHYRLSVNPGILPEKGSMFLNPEDPETEKDVTF